jgi:hypothetical protein
MKTRATAKGTPPMAYLVVALVIAAAISTASPESFRGRAR